MSYVWGVAQNFLVVLPLIILASLGLGYIHFHLIHHPFLAIAIGVGVFSLLANLITAWAWWSSEANFQSLKKSWWANFSAFFGWILLGLIVSTLIVITSNALEWMRDIFRDEVIGIIGGSSVVVGSFWILHQIADRLPVSNAAKSLPKLFWWAWSDFFCYGCLFFGF